MIKSIKAKVIDSCIKVIVGRPVISSNHLFHKIPSYFDEVESRCQSNQEARPVSTPVCCTCHSEHRDSIRVIGHDSFRRFCWIPSETKEAL